MKVDIRPTRENWADFCEEPELTEAEHDEWREMAQAIRGNDNLFDALMEATAERTGPDASESTDDWSDMVAWADAWRRLRRAELAWWRSYNARKPGAYYTPAHIYDGAQGSGGFLAAMGNPPYGDDDA